MIFPFLLAFLFLSPLFIASAQNGSLLFSGLQSISAPAREESTLPFLHTNGDGRLLMSWVESGSRATHALQFSEFDGERWSTVRTVVEGDSLFHNWADVPSVVRLRDGRIVAHWLNRSGDGSYAYDVKLRISEDQGLTWSPTLTPHRDRTQTEHGFVSFFDSPKEGTGLVWLDGREMGSDGTDDHGGHGAMGNMTLRGAFISSQNTVSPEIIIDARVCECCPTSSAVTERGVIVVYRNRSEEEVRDIYVTRLVDGTWTEGRPVHEDGWNISGCPVNGPAVAAEGRRVAVAWFTAPEGNAQVNVAFSSDEGATFSAPLRVDDGMPLGRVAVAFLSDGSALVLWIEWREEGATLRVRRVWENRSMSDPYVVATVSADRASGYPRMVQIGHNVYFAWTDTKEGKRVLMASLPIVEFESTSPR